jgi:hypothetical protein
MGCIKAVIAGAEERFGGWIVKEFSIGFFVIADDDGFDCL